MSIRDEAEVGITGFDYSRGAALGIVFDTVSDAQFGF